MQGGIHSFNELSWWGEPIIFHSELSAGIHIQFSRTESHGCPQKKLSDMQNLVSFCTINFTKLKPSPGAVCHKTHQKVPNAYQNSHVPPSADVVVFVGALERNRLCMSSILDLLVCLEGPSLFMCFFCSGGPKPCMWVRLATRIAPTHHVKINNLGPRHDSPANATTSTWQGNMPSACLMRKIQQAKPQAGCPSIIFPTV